MHMPAWNNINHTSYHTINIINKLEFKINKSTYVHSLHIYHRILQRFLVRKDIFEEPEKRTKYTFCIIKCSQNKWHFLNINDKQFNWLFREIILRQKESEFTEKKLKRFRLNFEYSLSCVDVINRINFIFRC